jgi:hypothetical protein
LCVCVCVCVCLRRITSPVEILNRQVSCHLVQPRHRDLARCHHRRNPSQRTQIRWLRPDRRRRKSDLSHYIYNTKSTKSHMLSFVYLYIVSVDGKCCAFAITHSTLTTISQRFRRSVYISAWRLRSRLHWSAIDYITVCMRFPCWRQSPTSVRARDYICDWKQTLRSKCTLFGHLFWLQLLSADCQMFEYQQSRRAVLVFHNRSHRRTCERRLHWSGVLNLLLVHTAEYWY